MWLSENGKRGVNYKEMCNEWNSVVMAEMEDIKSVAGDIEVDDLFDRLRLKTTCQLSTYATIITDRCAGVKALQPYVQEYKRLCHDLKQADADTVLLSPQVECKAQTPVPGRRLVQTRATLPMPSSFAGSKAVRSVFVSSFALAPRDTNVPLAGPNKRAHEAVVSSPESRKVAKTITATQQNYKLELCSECLVRRGIKKVVYVEFPDGESSSFHGGRQNGRKDVVCPESNMLSLTKDEKAKRRAILQTMRRAGELQALYEQALLER